MSEANLWDYLSCGMGNRWEAQRHEDKLTSGIPDVSYSMNGVHGWIELKYLSKPPNGNSAIMVIKHYTPDQRNWIERHGKAGGRVFILLRVDTTYMLFDWKDTRYVGRVSYKQHRGMAIGLWDYGLDFDHLHLLLLKQPKNHLLHVP